MNWTWQNAVVCGCVLTALNLFGGRPAWAAITARDFSHYQLILDKNPFGEVTPSEDAQTQVAPGELIAKEIEMKSIVDDGSGIRIGLLDKKANKNFILAVGEEREGLQLVSVDYDNEEAVVKKEGATAVIRLRPDKNKDMAAAASSSAALDESPFPAPPSLSPAARRPFFSDLRKRKASPFQPLGTNAFPFQAKSVDSFFKASTGAVPNAQSPFGPFQASQGGAPPGAFQQITPLASNMPNPFAPISPPNQTIRPDSKGATIDQLLQWQPAVEGQEQPPVNQLPAGGEIPAE